MSNTNANFENGVLIGMLAEMVVDSTGASYVAWGTTGVSGYAKYDTNGNLVTTYDRVADTTGETLGIFASKPAVVVLPDDTFFWFQFVNKNSTDYLMGSKWDSSGNVIFKNRTLDVSHMIDPVTGKIAPNPSSNERHTGTAEAVGNIFLSVNSTQGKLLKFNSEGTFISGTNESNISQWSDEVTLATNGESIYAVGADAENSSYGKFTKFSNTLTTDVAKYNIGFQMKQDIYVDPTSCFVYVASVTYRTAAWDYNLGNPTAPAFYQFSNNTINVGARKFLLYRVNNDMVLNGASSSCPTPGSLPSTTTPVSIAGNGSELGSYVHSGLNGWGELSIKYSSASTPVAHSESGVDKIFYSTNHDCILIGATLKCKDIVPGGLGDSAGTTSSSTYVEVDSTKLGSVTSVSVGSNFTCAVGAEHGNLNDNTYCWGEGNRGRLGIGGIDSYTTPQEVLGGV